MYLAFTWVYDSLEATSCAYSTNIASFSSHPFLQSGPSGDVALRLLANPLAFLEEVKQQHGKIVGMVLGGERVVLVADSAIAEQVLITENSTVAKVQIHTPCLACAPCCVHDMLVHSCH